MHDKRSRLEGTKTYLQGRDWTIIKSCAVYQACHELGIPLKLDMQKLVAEIEGDERFREKILEILKRWKLKPIRPETAR